MGTTIDALKQQLSDKQDKITDLNLELSVAKETIAAMKGTLGDKIDETAKLNGKIHRVEKKFGSRLSQIDLSAVQKQLIDEENRVETNGVDDETMQIPDYRQTTTKKQKHRKQRSSTTLALDQLNDDFSAIAKNVSAYGSKQPMVSGPTHYRKFSNTTKMIMEQHKTPNEADNAGWKQMNGKGKGHRARDSMKIGDIVDENGIDFDDEYEQQLERQSNDEKDEEERVVKSRTSRESRQLNDNELPSVDEDSDSSEHEMKEETPKRVKKNKKSRESRQLDDSEWVDQSELSQPKRKEKSRASGESRQIENSDLGYEDEEEEEEQKPTKKARGSVQM